jgi:8-amino-7-oxononanoate synthase
MDNSLEQRIAEELHSLETKQRKRSFQLPKGIDFTSNDYLGFTHDADLRAQLSSLLLTDIPLGSGGSRLLRGNHIWHEQAERDFAEFQDTESSLFFSSGYSANMAVLTALPSRRDAIIYDANVHASIKEGVRASLAKSVSFQHNSLDSLRAAASRLEAEHVFIVVESLYSMDGDEAPLRELASFAHDAKFSLVVDEAHATGIFGKHGQGLVDECGVRDQTLLSIHPCGKALASSGAFVASSELVRSYLLNKARTMIFTTALPPIIPAMLSAVIRKLASTDERIRTLFENSAFVRESLRNSLKTWTVPEGRSPIIPVIIGTDEMACAVGDELQRMGMDVRPIRPPTVAEGTARFRITINADHTQSELDLLVNSLTELEKKYAN